MRTTSSSRRECVRRECKNTVTGQQQVCDDCHAKDLLCRKCSRPHGGAPTTKLCPKCRAKSRGRRRSPSNPHWTPEEDAKLREIYSTSSNRDIGRKAREAFPNRPRWSIKRRAAVIGAATVRRKEPRWTPEEDAFLNENAWMTPERIGVLFRRRGFNRTITAISVRMKRFRVRAGIDGMTATGLAELLDVDIHLVSKWISNGWLRAERSGTTGDNHDRWHISTSAIREFLVAHPEQYTLTKLERVGSKMWFMEMVTGGVGHEGFACPAGGERLVAIADERVPLSALADMCGRDVASLVRRIDGLGMSVEQAAFGPEDIVDEPRATELGVEVGCHLDAIIRESGWSVRKVTQRAKVPALMASRLLRGRLPLLPPTLLALADALGYEARIELVPRKP
jgi:hypothetical protein